MPDRTLQFSEVRLQRILGIRPEQAFGLEDFSPGLNVIHGDNGSGKTTLSRALQEMIWPGATGLTRPSLAGAYRDGSDRWDLDLEAGFLECRRNGESAPPPVHPMTELRSSYRLALDELITTRDADFATAIARESRGGYDLDQAAKNAGFQSKPSQPKNLWDAYQAAKTRLQTSEEDQKQWHEATQQLEDLRAEEEEARSATQHIALLRDAAEHAERKRECEELQRQRDSLASCAPLQGDEKETLQSLDGRERSLQDDLHAARLRQQDAESRLTECRLDALPEEDGLIPGLKELARQLKDSEQALATTEEQLRDARLTAEDARARLGDRFPEDPPSENLSRHAASLSELANRHDRWLSGTHGLEERLRLLKEEPQGDTENVSLDSLLAGILALEGWLATPERATSTDRIPAPGFTIACLLATGFALLLSFLHHLAWALALLLPAGLFFHQTRNQTGSVTGDDRDRRTEKQRAFMETSLPPPGEWTPAAVEQRLIELIRQQRGVTQQELRIRERQQLRDQLRQRAAEKDSLDEQLRQIGAETGLRIDLDGRWLPLLVDHLREWQKHDALAQQLETKREELDGDRRRHIEQLTRTLGPFDPGAIDNAALASAAIDSLEDRLQRFRSATSDTASAARDLQRLEADLAEVRRQRAALFDRVGLAEDKRDELNARLQRHPEYLDLCDRFRSASTLRDNLRQRLESAPEWRDADLDAITAERDRRQRMADRMEELGRQIYEIEHAIRAAKKGHDRVDALTAFEQARNALADRREENFGAIAGATLTDWVRKQTSETLRPRVFQLADRRLVDFTGGAFRLDVTEQDGAAAFRVRFTDGRVEPVENLSTGERVQLFIAIRMAFIESEETVRLPLLLDEVLGTSDDHRTEAIIRVVTEIVKSGRQVFYFTAQRDEVEKWRAGWTAATGELPPLKEFDLNEIRGLAATRRIQVRPHVPPEQPPAPEGRDHAAYGRELDVHGIDVREGTVDTVHLWHLVDDVDLLHELLCRRVRDWGGLRNFLDFADDSFSTRHADALRRTHARARLLQHAIEFRQVGLARPLDRTLIAEADCISETFRERMGDLAEECHGDAAGILRILQDDATRREKMKGWQKNSTSKLEEYLIQKGCLSEEIPLGMEEIGQRLHALAESCLTAGDLTLADVDRIIDLVALPA